MKAKPGLFWAVFRLIFRLNRKSVLIMLAMAAAALVLSAAAALAGNSLFSGQNFSAVRLVVADEGGDERVAEMLALMARMPDLAAWAQVQQATPEEAEAAVHSGQASAALILPPGFLDSVLAGENDPPGLLVAAGRPLDRLATATVARSASGMLAAAQRGVFMAIEAMDRIRPDNPAREADILAVNMEYVGLLLGRGGMIREEAVSPTGSLTVGGHYLLSAFLLLASLGTAALYSLYSLRENGSWLGRVRASGFPGGLYVCAQVLCGACAIFVMMAALVAGGALAADFVGARSASPLAALPGALAASLLLSCAAFLFCNTGGVVPAVLTTFLVSAGALFLSGGIVPAVLLPPSLAALMPLSPFTWLRDALSPLFGVRSGGESLVFMLLLTAVLFAGCLFVGARHDRRGVL